MSQGKIVTWFHEYVMKKYEVLAFYIIAIAKVVTKCSIIVTNPNYGKTCQISDIGNIKCTKWGNKRRKTTKKGGELHHHQRSPEIRGWSPKRLDPPMLERRCSRQLSKSATTFLRVSMRVSMASIAGWTFLIKQARAISRRWSRMNSTANPMLTSS